MEKPFPKIDFRCTCSEIDILTKTPIPSPGVDQSTSKRSLNNSW